MELWQMDVVGGLALADGSTAKALTGVDDHSRCRPAGSSMTTRPGPGRRCRPAVLKALDTGSSAWPGWRDAGFMKALTSPRADPSIHGR
jgi:hypothetical protein